MVPRSNPYSPATLEAMHRNYASSRCTRLRNRLVEAHLNLVRQQAQRQAQRCNLGFDDLFQIGCLGLLAAVEGFDPSKGNAFSTYAVPLIVGQMRHYGVGFGIQGPLEISGPGCQHYEKPRR
ncbi:MAG: sigma-70 family RNA polymerase sigma factor [Synechococcaceae bacterium WBA_3_309]|nr:sigma-70 family RNA polymerase sigma factor [Synechococcaceae bacterium WBA_3_309]